MSLRAVSPVKILASQERARALAASAAAMVADTPRIIGEVRTLAVVIVENVASLLRLEGLEFEFCGDFGPRLGYDASGIAYRLFLRLVPRHRSSRARIVDYSPGSTRLADANYRVGGLR